MSTRQAELVLHHLRRMMPAARQEPASDRELLRQFAARHDEDAFAALLARHGPMVLRVARGVLHDAHAAEDVFQATFLVLARQAGSTRWQESIANYLYGVAYRLALKARSAATRRRAHESRAPARPAADPLAELTVREAQAVLAEELSHLADRHRAPLVLCYLEGMTRDQAARQLGWPEGTLKRRLERGRELLRRGLVRRGLTIPAALAAALFVEGTAPAVPPALARATLRAALTSAPAAALSLLKLKATTALLLLAGLLTGAGMLARRAPAKIPSPSAPDPSPPARTDSFGDPLPPGALARAGTVRFRHGAHLRSLAVSPDGKRIASLGIDQTVRVWDAATGRQLRSMTDPDGNVQGLAFSPDGKTLASGIRMRTVRLWDVTTGRQVHKLSTSYLQSWFQPLAFSPDGKLVASAGYGADVQKKSLFGDVRVWDAATGKELRALRFPGTNCDSVVFSPDARLLAVADVWGRVHLFETATGKNRFVAQGDKRARVLGFSADGKTLAQVGGYGDKEKGTHWAFIALWDTATGKQLALHRTRMTPPAGPSRVTTISPDREALTVALSPDLKTLAFGIDGRFYLVDVPAGKERLCKDHPDRAYYHIDFFPDGRRFAAAAGSEGRIEIRDSRTGEEVRPEGPGAQSSVHRALLTPDGRTLVTSDNEHTIRLWDAATGKPLRVLGTSPADDLAWSPDGRTLAAGGPDAGRYVITLWDVATGRRGRTFPNHFYVAVTLCFSGDGKTLLAAGSTSLGSAGLRAWDVATGRKLREVDRRVAGPELGRGDVRLLTGPRAVLSPDTRLLALESSTAP